MTNSIRHRLLLLVLMSVVVVWAVALATSYWQAEHEVGEWDNGRLEQAAGVLLVVDEANLNKLAQVGFIGSDDDDSQGIHQDATSRELQFEVRGVDGKLLAKTSKAPLASSADALTSTSRNGAYVVKVADNRWNTYTLHSNLTGRSARVFERVGGRSNLTSEVSRRIARPLTAALPILALVIWLSISQSFSPLSVVSREIGDRGAENLDPIKVRQVPDEVLPLIDALNKLLDRLRRSFARERAFTSDAAHELKTPLTAIKVQTQVAMAAQDPSVRQLAMQRVVEAVDRSAHLAQQLLVLARLDEAALPDLTPVSINPIVRKCAAAQQANAASRGATLSFIHDTPMKVRGDPTLLEIMIDNLLDNALKYGSCNGRIEIDIFQEQHNAVLSVRDNGPGVALNDRFRLGDRFFRVLGNRESGSGLGLSIVNRVATVLGAHVRYTTGIGGEGLAVTVAFPNVSSEHASLEA
jgi:two-component system sensor histidine kinase QseC